MWRIFWKRLLIVGSSMAFGLLLMSFLPSSKNQVSLVSSTLRYSQSGGPWTEWQESAIPIVIDGKDITFGAVPVSVLRILETTGQASDDSRNTTYKCRNAKGTEFTVKLVYSSATSAILNVENASVKMSYKCVVAKEKPYLNMVDLGLSCKWGLSNYYNYKTDIVSAAFGAGKRMTYDDAVKAYGSGKQHLPTNSQIQELLTKCTWEFINDPDGEIHMGYLVTGPNGNSIFFPCEDGGDGRLSSAWYLGSESFDAFLCNALQLNINSRIIHPYEKKYYGCIRLVEDK